MASNFWMRFFGNPSRTDHHLTLGVSYDLSHWLNISLGWVHSHVPDVSERGTDILGQPVRLESSTTSEAIDFGLTFFF